MVVELRLRRTRTRRRCAAFPPPELPGFSGTMQRSDSLSAICFPCLFDLYGILGSRVIGIHLATKSQKGLPGCLDDIV